MTYTDAMLLNDLPGGVLILIILDAAHRRLGEIRRDDDMYIAYQYSTGRQYRVSAFVRAVSCIGNE